MTPFTLPEMDTQTLFYGVRIKTFLERDSYPYKISHTLLEPLPASLVSCVL